MGVIAGFVGALLLCSGVAFWIGTQQSRGLSSEVYAEQRLPLINAALDEAKPGFIYLAGDSHAEYAGSAYRLCGREVVNGGVSGAKAELYRDLAPRLAFAAAPDAIVLTIGTNNLLRKKDPLSAAPLAEFESNVARTLETLGKTTKRLIVTAVPPIGAEFGKGFEIPAVAAYSERLRNLCRKSGCLFVDPFAESREQDGSTARPGAMRDGVHMKSYRGVHERLGSLICPGGNLPAP
jgi:lysophospholipase L1-like esterase